MEKWFRFWMAFYGKTFSDFKLVHGDFLQPENRPEILESTIVFVNNFAFGPEVDQHLKDIFADLTDGSRIFSSKSFCALNFRITDRNLSGKLQILSNLDITLLLNKAMTDMTLDFKIGQLARFPFDNYM